MGKIDEQLSSIPTPTYHRDKEKLLKHLDNSYREMLTYVVKQLSQGVKEQNLIREIEIMRQVNIWTAKLDADMAKGLDNLIKKTFNQGQAYHLLAVGEAATWDDAVASTSFNRVTRGKVEALLADTYEDILQATHNTAVAIKYVVRDTVSKVAQYHSLRNNHYDEQAKDLYKQLTQKGLSENIQKKGFVGITDKAGRKWDLRVYSNMVIKTKTNQAFSEGIINEAQESGIDLAIISDHSAEDACSKWEGVIISMTGATQGYPTYAQVRATNQIFHPNCEHSFHPIRNIDVLSIKDLANARRKAVKLGLERPQNKVTPPTIIPEPAVIKPAKVEPAVIKPAKVEPAVIKPAKVEPAVIKPDKVADTAKITQEAAIDLTHENIKVLPINKDSEIYQKLGEKHYTNMHNIINKAPERYRKLWAKMEKELTIIDAASDEHPHCRGVWGIVLNVQDDSEGYLSSNPYQVTLHEFAHNIDNIANKKFGTKNTAQAFTETYKNGLFSKTIKKEMNEMVAKVQPTVEEYFRTKSPDWLYENGYITKKSVNDYYGKGTEIVYQKVHSFKHLAKGMQQDIKDNDNFSDYAHLSDVLEGASGGKFQIGAGGHGARYWKGNPNLVGQEAFAEFFDSELTNESQFNMLKKYLPKSYKVFEEIMDEIIKR